MTDKATDLSALSGRRILVVEDEMLLAMELQMILEDEGCVVLGPVPDIPRALALVEGEALDAATLDMNLNGESSLRIAAALQERGIPFLVISGYSNRAATEPPLRDAPHLAKPVVSQTLLRRLAELF
ncbi:response regulator [Salipiger marinus]|jgi:CheY-like chemotaxis protein|uniref:Response regulator receiver domain-containing protein n=1 Tax=Salipiger marinus TaxID=555512 RepID=A0A1G8M0A8_9RHOB|nr:MULTISPECIES: response regulator [Salipiger]MCD1619053.1 response regulator [Salipiger manganoxidans]MEB3420184.1 response regulator [Salipiger manganoxidans]SDI61325.1 Response regulator receiver domain-containing protein [Salipiger marinus]HBM62014.1 response regulator [Citreicella sp.]|tara:strand:- start:376 stop:756 length:381 start_codon:yes stop_codon:yes gene_type:complete